LSFIFHPNYALFSRFDLIYSLLVDQYDLLLFYILKIQFLFFFAFFFALCFFVVVAAVVIIGVY
jgi:hypothetical protein